MFSAPVTPGEFALGSVRMLPSPTTIVSGGFNNVLSSFKNFFKTPKSFIPTLAISAVWLILYILRACHISLPLSQFINTITLYGVGMSTNPLYFIGGLVGKGVFASAIVSLVYTLSGKRSNSKRGFLKMLEGWLKSAMEMGGKAIGKLIGDICGFIYMEFLKTSMTESVKRAGREAFDSALREGIKYSGGHITRELINTAQWAKSAAKCERIELLMDTAKELSKNLSDATAKFVGDCLKSGKVDHLFALLLHYSVGGKESDNEALGGNTADVIYGFFQDRFGLKVSQVLNTLANPMDISIRTEDGKLVIGIFDYSVYFDILENLKAMSSCAFDFLFTWMDVIWDAAKEGLNPLSNI